MKFEQEENLELNKIVDKKIKADKKFETHEDFIAHCVRKELGLKDVE
jgi:hypothetical protein